MKIYRIYDYEQCIISKNFEHLKQWSAQCSQSILHELESDSILASKSRDLNRKFLAASIGCANFCLVYLHFNPNWSINLTSDNLETLIPKILSSFIAALSLILGIFKPKKHQGSKRSKNLNKNQWHKVKFKNIKVNHLFSIFMKNNSRVKKVQNNKKDTNRTSVGISARPFTSRN